MYKNDIRNMDDAQLQELIDEYALITDEEYFDCEEVIELLEEKIGTIFECIEDDILDSIRYGNWNDAAKVMHENYITPHALIDYIEDYRYEVYDDAYEWFDLSSAATITELYYRKEVA